MLERVGEVKELAQQTARATGKIVAKVSATQADVTAATDVIAQIGEVIARIDGLQGTIAAAVEEQSATTSEMVRNVTEVSTGSREITANISGIAAGRDADDEQRHAHRNDGGGGLPQCCSAAVPGEPVRDLIAVERSTPERIS